MQTYTAHQQDLFLTHHTQLLWFPSHGQVDVCSARKKYTIDGNKTSFTFPAAAKSKKKTIEADVYVLPSSRTGSFHILYLWDTAVPRAPAGLRLFTKERSLLYGVEIII
jgi:hypothetical protein